MPKTQWETVQCNKALQPCLNSCSPRFVAACKKTSQSSSVPGLSWDNDQKTMTILGHTLNLTSSDPVNTVGISVDPTTTTYNVTLPPTQGSASTVLVNDGTGQLSWTPMPQSLKREWIMYSDAHTGTNQALTYAYAPTLFTGTGDVPWTNDPDLIFDNTYFSISQSELTCTTDIPQDLTFRLQVFIVFDTASVGEVSIIPKINGLPFGLDTISLATQVETHHVCMKVNESLNTIVAGDVITLTLDNPDSAVALAFVNYKAWLQP